MEVSRPAAEPICSYAQNFEDVLLWRALHGVADGFYVDVGAQHPVVDSVSRAFYERGWRGVHVEPSGAYAELLRAERPDEKVVQAVVGARDGLIRFFEIAGTGLSTADPDIAARHAAAGYALREIDVAAITMDTLLAAYAERDIHWLKIDVEGFESQVLAGWTLPRPRPWIVVIESTLPMTQEASAADWEHRLVELGYEHVYADGLNKYFVSVLHPELKAALRTPPNVFDQFELSGTATSSFTRRLTQQIDAERAQHAGDVEALRTQHRHDMQAIHEDRQRAAALLDNLRGGEAALRAELADARARLHAALEEVGRGRGEIAGLEAQLAVERGHARHYRATIERDAAERASLQKGATEQQARLDEALERVRDHERDVAALRAGHANELAASEAALAHARERAAHFESAYRVVAESRSWRLTAPLRHLFGAARRMRSGIADALRSLRGLPKRTGRKALARGLDYLRTHPGHKARVARMTRPFGTLDARLRAFAARRPVAGAGVAEPVPASLPAVGSQATDRSYGPANRVLGRRMDYVADLERQLDEADERRRREIEALLREIERLKTQQRSSDANAGAGRS